MSKSAVNLTLSPEEAFKSEVPEEIVLSKTGAKFARILKRSIDARKRQVVVHIQAEVSDQEIVLDLWKPRFKAVSDHNKCIIVGSGPAGLFAAIKCLELGIKPIILERGKDVRARRRDLAALNKESIVNEDSNYCFGEGGAGTYSDGKLYTRSGKRGNINEILEILVFHGARHEILFEAHPHIGTNKLPAVVASIRQTILDGGGVIHFDHRVTDFKIVNNKISAVQTENGELFEGDHVILATGHSARDIFELLDKKEILIEQKPFAIGVRIEHPQQLIDEIQYHQRGPRSPFLPAASYSLTHQCVANNNGVFSFCMCPGGFIVPSATAPGEIVVNGMSPSKRDSFFANSGLVVSVNEVDFTEFSKHGALAGMYYQKAIEQRAFEMTAQSQIAPAQRVGDFLRKKVSSTLNDTSYVPGLQSMEFEQLLPKRIYQSIHEGLSSFGKKMKGYSSNDAQIIGIESRTSSPVRIPRNRETFRHPVISNLFPCGEGAGFAGGIVSAAIDGIKCASAILQPQEL